MAKKVEKEQPEDFESAYKPVDITSLLREWKDGEQVGEPSRVAQLDDILKWMRGTINAWYGWANDGKGTFFDFMAVTKSALDGWKWCMMKQEDMSSTRYRSEPARITANRIHKSLMWTKTGITPYRHYAKKNNIPHIGKDQYVEALEWVDEHFKIIYPKDRKYRNVMDNFKFMHEKFGIDGFLIDPFKSLKLSGGDDKRTDWMMDDLFIECKEFALHTNTTFNFIAHPKSLTDVRVTKDPHSAFKVVTQFMIAGGAAWDNNMDSQYSVYRPNRHTNASDPSVHLWNLKQRNAEEVLAKRGVYEMIKFDPDTKRYYFDQICPLDASQYRPAWEKSKQPIINFDEPKPTDANKDDLPF
jgi:hypothetical protein